MFKVKNFNIYNFLLFVKKVLITPAANPLSILLSCYLSQAKMTKVQPAVLISLFRPMNNVLFYSIVLVEKVLSDGEIVSDAETKCKTPAEEDENDQGSTIIFI